MIRCLIALALVVFALTMPAAAQLGMQPSPSPDAEAATDAADIDVLIRILEDDAARERLIATLRDSASPAETVEEPESPHLAAQVARYTRAAAEAGAGMISGSADLISHSINVITGVTRIDWWELYDTVINISIVVVLTFLAFALARLGAARLSRSMIAAAAHAGTMRRIGIALAVALLDTATVIAAWTIGHVAGLRAGAVGQLSLSQTLFLNAFLVVGIALAVTRALLAPRHPDLRLIRMNDTTAAYWYIWTSRLIGMIGYAFLLIAPVLDILVSEEAADGFLVIVLLAALAMVSAVILQNRAQFRSWLMRRAQANQSGFLGRALGIFARVWHMIAIGYLLLVFVLWLSDHDAALPFVLRATLNSAIAIAIGFGVVAVISRLASSGMRLSDDLRQRLPLLEYRLNAFVPNVLRAVGWAVLGAVLIAIIQIWHLADIIGWLASEFGQQILSALLSIAIVLAFGALLHLAMSSWVEYRLNPNYGTVPSPRERTLLSLLRNAVTVFLAVLVAMLVMAALGVNIGPLLAGAGVVGLAVGFGAQKMVQDVISGIFIQFENAMNEGDVVTAGGITGVVEKLTIRSVSLRSLDGVYHVVPFSSVDAVSNYMKYYGFHVAEIAVAYRERIPDVKQAMRDAFDRLRATEHSDNILEDMEMHGVTQFGDSAVVVRGRIKTVSGEQWGIGRAYNEILKEIFDERRIEIPFPHRTLYMGVDHDGNAPAIRIEQVEKSNAKTDKATAAKPARRRSRKKTSTDRDPRPEQDSPPGQESAPEDAT